MGKLKIAALLLALALLLTGCSGTAGGTMESDPLLERAGIAMEEGQLFFAGKVISAKAEKKAISFYDAETAESTFYKVEVTEDLFGAMPERVLTVCVMGTGENFTDRVNLKKDQEYLFHVSLWVSEEETVFLLPTFYESMPEREGDTLYYSTKDEKYQLDRSYTEYKEKLLSLAGQHGYGPKRILERAEERMKSAAERDAAYFEDLNFETIDEAALAATAARGADLLKKVQAAEQNWEGIKELLK